MKKITLLAASALLLLTACGQTESVAAEVAPPATVVQEDIQQPQATPEPVIAMQKPVMGQEQPQVTKAPQTETIPEVTQTPEPVTAPTLSEDIPSAPEPEPTPEPAAPADRQAAIDAANAYAVSQYGVTTGSSLTLDNSAYRFPAAVPVNASQETLEAKARDMVDFTFRQLMMQAGRDTIADAGFHCNICIVEDGGSLLIYVLYDG